MKRENSLDSPSSSNDRRKKSMYRQMADLKSFASRIRKSFLGSEEESETIQSPGVEVKKTPRRSLSDRARKHSGVSMLKRFFKRSLIGIEDSDSDDEDDIPFGTMTQSKSSQSKKIIRHSHSVGNLEDDIQQKKLTTTFRLKEELAMKKSDHRDKSDEFELILGLIVECSDLGHPARPLRLHQRWSVMVSQEFYAQGRTEEEHGVPISPMCEPESELSRKNFAWAKGQQCFIDFLVHPKFDALSQVCNVADNSWSANLVENHAFWDSRDKLCCWEELSIEVGKEYTFAMAMERCRGPKIDREDSSASARSAGTNLTKEDCWDSESSGYVSS